MGVSLTAWRKVEFVRPLREGEEGGEEWPALMYLHAHHPGHRVVDDLVDGLYKVSGDREQALAAEYKRTPPDDDQIYVDLGSNEGYADWLEQLEDAAREWKALRLFRPFLDLDPLTNPVLIGPKTSKEMLRGFAAHADRYEAFAKTLTGEHETEFFLMRYRAFLRAFELAKGEGAVFL